MRLRHLAAPTALALILVSLTPVAAHAADTSVSGTVTLDGVAVAGTEVGWYEPATGATGETVTDAVGAYSIAVTDGHSYLMYAGIDHKGTTWTSLGAAAFTGAYLGSNGTDTMFHTLTPFAPGDSTAKNIALGHPGTITGHNAKLKNRTIKAVSVVGDTLKQVKTDASGTYTFADLIPGRYRIKASRWTSGELDVAAAATVVANPVLKTTTGMLRGTVTLNGKPLAKLPLYVVCNGEWGGYAMTSATGRYSFTKLQAGKCSVDISRYGDDSPIPGSQPYALTSVKTKVVAKKTTTKNFSVRLAATVTGSITPTKGATYVQAVVSDKKGTALGGAYLIVEKGKKLPALKIQGLPSGTFTLLLTDDKKKYYAKRSITVKLGTTTNLGALTLNKKTLTIKGSVVQSDGQAATRVSYTPENAYLQPGGQARIKNGTYTIRGLVPGKGTLQATGKAIVNRPYLVKWVGFKNVTLSKLVTKKKVRAVSEPLYGRHVGTFVAGGAPVRSIRLGAVIPDLSPYEFGNSIAVSKGEMVGATEQDGTFRYEIDQDGVDAGFVKGSPFWLTLPADNNTFAAKRGTTVDIGVVTLVVDR